MSENDNCRCLGTTNVAVKLVKVMKGTPKEESLKVTSENRHRGCGRDMLGQQQQGRPNHRWWTAVYDREPATFRMQMVYYRISVKSTGADA